MVFADVDVDCAKFANQQFPIIISHFFSLSLTNLFFCFAGFWSVDVGGWNNIRMQMELVLVFAAATGRTLVLPPDQPMYLLNAGKGHQKAHNFADFFPFDLISQRISVISMEEYLAREGVAGNLRRQTDNVVLYPPG